MQDMQLTLLPPKGYWTEIDMIEVLSNNYQIEIYMALEQYERLENVAEE